ncbi:hypothetical protein SGLAU_28020 [Streptomyces glaucescens]|uniref:Uncharacterized protein n=1 Tax=Streptomyces glaucescens TaxID=1907 RepID=A0A089Z6Y2_STRGA|nr:hypothetical protein SGLAU_28020 [Streptomyces glaucescens]
MTADNGHTATYRRREGAGALPARPATGARRDHDPARAVPAGLPAHRLTGRHLPAEARGARHDLPAYQVVTPDGKRSSDPPPPGGRDGYARPVRRSGDSGR